ncbi:MAG: hypothetical protein ACI4IL_01440 [Eubacterium sp.]
MVTLYIDPSVMTYALQIVVGAVITVGAILGVVFRKAKKKVKKTLNIEEKKEVEEDIIDYSETKE